MTREEAIRLLKTQRIDGDDLHEAFDMAIKSIENQKHAHWKKSKETEGIIYCSLCHYNQYVYKMPFCALCGARMDEEEGAEDGTD